MCKLDYAFWTILQAIDETGHGLKSCGFLIKIDGSDVLILDVEDNLVDLVEMALVSILGDNNFDLFPCRLSFFFMPK